MPVIGPHLSIRLQVGVSFCDGHHEGGEPHQELIGAAGFVLAPPMDDAPKGWPPGGQEEAEPIVTGTLNVLLGNFCRAVEGIPGAMPVEWDGDGLDVD